MSRLDHPRKAIGRNVSRIVASSSQSILPLLPMRTIEMYTAASVGEIKLSSCHAWAKDRMVFMRDP
jgi:hypothetical protein